MSSLGERLRQERERLGITREKFGEISGVTGTTQTNYERDSKKPDTDYLLAIEKAGADIFYILRGEPSPKGSLAEDEQELLSSYRGLDIRGKVNALGLINSLRNTTDKVKETYKASGITVHGSVGDVSQIKGNVKIGNITKTTRIGGDTKKKPPKS